MYYYKNHSAVKDRFQDSAKFVNKRYNLVGNLDPEAQYIRDIFTDPEIKQALVSKFCVEPFESLASSLVIHEEFEYIYPEAGRFQNIHMDIPPKFLSLVFYLPEQPVSQDEEDKNATVLYDKNLEPQHHAKYKANSACVFAPHFFSYHGFSSTIARGVLIMFYIIRAEMEKWNTARLHDHTPFDSIRDCIQAKLQTYPLLAYGHDRDRILEERAQCLINAPQGTVNTDIPRHNTPVMNSTKTVRSV